MSTPAPTSDLEIYLLKADEPALEQWLTDALGSLQKDADSDGPIRWTHTESGMRVIYTPKADGNFGCLWFKTNQTPWLHDLECARAAHAALTVEVRCAAAQWSESQQDDNPAWIKLIRGEEKPFHWH